MKALIWIALVLVLLEACTAAPARTELSETDEESLHSILKRLDGVLNDLLVKVDDSDAGPAVNHLEQRNEDGALPEINDLDLDKRGPDDSIPEFVEYTPYGKRDKAKQVPEFTGDVGSNKRRVHDNQDIEDPSPERSDGSFRSSPNEITDEDGDASLLQVLRWLQSLRAHRKTPRGDHDIPFP